MSLNVFADLDLPKPDEHFLKASLLLAIADIMRKSGLTQTEIAQRTGLKQPEVSRIMSERWADCRPTACHVSLSALAKFQPSC
jgi:predicted XRE-type DNA-binding protein